MQYRLLFVTAFLFCSLFGFAQNTTIKTLQTQILQSSDSLRYTDAVNKLATLYYQIDADSLLLYTTKARDAARRLNYAKGKADASNNLGILEEIKGNAQQAFRYYVEAYDRYSKINDQRNRLQSMMNIALVYCEMDNSEKSLLHFRKAFTLADGLEQDSISAILYANYVSCFSSHLSQDSIDYFLTKAKKISEKYNDEGNLLFIDQLSAENEVAKLNAKQAVVLLKATLQSALQKNLFYSVTDILIDLGNTVPDSAEAANYYFQALRLSEDKGFRMMTRYAYEELYDFYQAKGNDALSLMYAQKLLDFYTSQKDIDNASGIDYVDYASVNQKLNASVLSSRYQKRMLWLIITICALFLVLIIFLLRSRRKMRRASMALNTQFKQSKLTMESLDRMNKNYSRVIKVVAHDLRNPLSSISMIGEMMEPYRMTPKEMEKLITLIKTTSKSCFELIEELLVTELDQEFTLEKKETSLDDILLQCLHLLSFKAKEKGQQIILTNKHHMTLFVDVDKIVRVLNNLVINAIKFSHEGSTIHIKTFSAANNIVITVTDNGIGIPDIIANRIFDPFTSAKRKGTNGENTFGLGLYITKQIVEAHNGNIWFKSEPGRGTTFFVELPAKSSRPYHLPVVSEATDGKEHVQGFDKP